MTSVTTYFQWESKMQGNHCLLYSLPFYFIIFLLGGGLICCKSPHSQTTWITSFFWTTIFIWRTSNLAQEFHSCVILCNFLYPYLYPASFISKTVLSWILPCEILCNVWPPNAEPSCNVQTAQQLHDTQNSCIVRKEKRSENFKNRVHWSAHIVVGLKTERKEKHHKQMS